MASTNGIVRISKKCYEISRNHRVLLESFAPMKDLLYGKELCREAQIIGTDSSSKAWGTSHTYVSMYGLHPSIEKRKQSLPQCPGTPRMVKTGFCKNW